MKVADWPYQSSETIMLPYSEKVTAIFGDDFLVQLYRKLKEDDTLATIFPGMDLSHSNHLVSYLCKVHGLVICCLKTASGKPDPIGFGWLAEVDKVKGSFGFGFFKHAWRRREHIDLSFSMLAYWFETANIQHLYGTTLNPIANNYSKRFGFRHIGVMPGFFDCNGVGKDAHLIVLEKEVFLRYRAQWKSKRG